jgi:hypothetical protein
MAGLDGPKFGFPRRDSTREPENQIIIPSTDLTELRAQVQAALQEVRSKLVGQQAETNVGLLNQLEADIRDAQKTDELFASLEKVMKIEVPTQGEKTKKPHRLGFN